jgi:hypothetical protein
MSFPTIFWITPSIKASGSAIADALSRAPTTKAPTVFTVNVLLPTLRISVSVEVMLS